MENHRESLRQLRQNADFGRYCGPAESAISHLRDPIWLEDRLKRLACYPETSVTPPQPFHRDERWLRKPLAGAAGRAISIEDAPPLGDEPCYWQLYTAGTPFSVLYLVSAESCEVLMLSRQLIGLKEVAAPSPFAYCGSIGPWPVSPEMNDQLLEVGTTLVAGLEYRGLLGVDLIWDARRFWVIEVNPRCTASSELWDFATGRSAVGEHLAACGFGGVAGAEPKGSPGIARSGISLLKSLQPRPPSDCEFENSRFVSTATSLRGKLILYADQNIIAPSLERWLAPRPPWSSPFLADIPQAASTIPPGAPICTVFAAARSAEACFRKLVRRARRVRRRFRESENSAGINNNS